MAFDFSRDSDFIKRSSPEESLFSPFMSSDHSWPRDWDGLDPFCAEPRCSSCSSNPEMEKSGDHGKVDDNKADDIADRLPADPFDMEIRSTFTAITGWIEDLDVDFGDFDIMNETEAGDHELLAELNWVWNESSGYMKIDGKTIPCDSFTGVLVDNQYNSEFVGDSDMEECLGFGCEGNLANTDASCSRDGEGGDPHDALEFALHYMAVKELLSVERVCRSLHEKIKSDCLLWRSIHIEWPLSGRITDDALFRITSRAQGALECLVLVECRRITDIGIKRVLEANTKLTKLSVPGCTRLTIEGILANLRAFKSKGAPGIKHLRIGGISTVTDKQFEEMKFLLGSNNREQKISHKPQFYQLYRAKKLNHCDEDRSIDIEKCPRCESLKLVYDCPMKSCQREAPLCRACLTCVGRCVHCGRCIKDCDYEETFCLDLLCLDCLFLKLEEAPEENGASSSKCTIFHQETRCSRALQCYGRVAESESVFAAFLTASVRFLKKKHRENNSKRRKKKLGSERTEDLKKKNTRGITVALTFE